MGGWMDRWVVGWVDSTHFGGQIFCQGIHMLFSHAHACTSLTLGASLPMLSEGFVPVMAAVPPSPSLHKHTSTGTHAEAPCSRARLSTPAPSSVHALVRVLTQTLGPGDWSRTNHPHGQKAAGCQKHQTVAAGFKVQSSPKEKPNSLQASCRGAIWSTQSI